MNDPKLSEFSQLRQCVESPQTHALKQEIDFALAKGSACRADGSPLSPAEAMQGRADAAYAAQELRELRNRCGNGYEFLP